MDASREQEVVWQSVVNSVFSPRPASPSSDFGRSGRISLSTRAPGGRYPHRPGFHGGRPGLPPRADCRGYSARLEAFEPTLRTARHYRVVFISSVARLLTFAKESKIRQSSAISRSFADTARSSPRNEKAPALCKAPGPSWGRNAHRGNRNNPIGWRHVPKARILGGSPSFSSA